MSGYDSTHVLSEGFIKKRTYTKGEECLTIRFGEECLIIRAGEECLEFAVYGMDSIRSLCSSLEEAALFMQGRIDERED